LLLFLLLPSVDYYHFLLPPIAPDAFVAAGWLVPPVDCFFLKIIILLLMLCHHWFIVELLSLQVAPSVAMVG